MEGQEFRRASVQAELVIARLFVAARAAQLAFSAVMVHGDRRRFARPNLQYLVLAAATAESAWLCRRLLAAGRFDDRLGMWADTVTSAAGLVVSGTGLGTDEAAPWMKNVAIGSALGAASSQSLLERASALGLLGGAALLTGVHAQGRDRHVAGFGLAVNDLISWTGMHTAVTLYVAAHRRYARLVDEAGSVALEQGRQAAEVAERSHQHRLVHQATIGVLKELANSEEYAEASAVARQEARRLRHILRTKGEMPSGLDKALYEVSEAVRTGGLKVELVTAELTTPLPEKAVSAVREAVHIALLAALECADADRAVVRAASQDTAVVVTVRHHSGGFRPGDGTPHDQRLAALSALLEGVSGDVELESAQGQGVRVTLTLPAPAAPPASRQGEPVADGHRSEPYGNPDDTTRQTPLERFFAGRAPGGHQGPNERAQADRTVATLFMAWRCSGLATGLAALLAGRHRYRSGSVAAAVVGVALAESAWLARHLRLQRFRWDRRSQVIDAATAVVLLVAGRANLSREGVSSWIDWAPWSFAANAVSGQALVETKGTERLAGAAAITVAATGAARTPNRLVNGFGIGACFAVGRLFVHQINKGAERLETARAKAVDEGRRLAIERERSRQMRLLHDGALQTLETVGSGRFPDVIALRAAAGREASRLEEDLTGAGVGDLSLLEDLASLAEEHRRLGLDVALSLSVVTEPPGAIRRALRDATHEALTNVTKHAGTSLAKVRVAARHDGVEVTVEDAGVGFRPERRVGFGTAESILRRMNEVGGHASIDSSPGQGTIIKLWGPA